MEALSVFAFDTRKCVELSPLSSYLQSQQVMSATPRVLYSVTLCTKWQAQLCNLRTTPGKSLSSDGFHLEGSSKEKPSCEKGIKPTQTQTQTSVPTTRTSPQNQKMTTWTVAYMHSTVHQDETRTRDIGCFPKHISCIAISSKRRLSTEDCCETSC